MADNMGSVATTTSVALGGAGSGAVVKWFFQCLMADHMVAPSDEASMMMAALLIPVVHILAKIAVAMLERWFGLDLNGNGHVGNGHAVETPK